MENQTLPNPDVILGEAWGIYKKRFKTLVGIMLIPFVAIVVMGAVLFASFILEIPSISLYVLAFIAFLGLAVVGFWGQIALLFSVMDEGGSLGIKSAYRLSWPYLLSFFWISLLVGCVIVGGYLLFIIPGIIFSVWFSFALYAARADGVRGMDALMRSKEYVRGQWGKVFLSVLLLMLFAFVFSIALEVVAAMMQTPWMVDVLSAIFNIFFTPFAFLYMYLIFKYLKQTKSEDVSGVKGGSRVPFILSGILGGIFLPLFVGAVIVIGLYIANLEEESQEMPVISEEISF